jgi:hypothetical protein
MADLEHIDKYKIINVIKNLDNYSVSSFSLKILLGQLKVKLEIDTAGQAQNECIEKVILYIKKYGNLPNVKKDIKELFGVDL